MSLPLILDPSIEFILFVSILKWSFEICNTHIMLIVKHTNFTEILFRRINLDWQGLWLYAFYHQLIFTKIISRLRLQRHVIQEDRVGYFTIQYFLFIFQYCNLSIICFMNLSSSLNLASETPLEKEEIRKIKTILQLLFDHNDSTQFRQPVDWQGLQLLDYTKIIKNPIDLGTINEKLQSFHYRFVQQILDDIQLVWDNCKTYNQSSSWIYTVADKMEKYYKKLIKNYFNNVVFSAPIKSNNLESSEPTIVPKSSRISNKKVQKNDNKLYNEQEDISLIEKEKLIGKIKKLNAENLGAIIEIILQNCSKACNYVQDDQCQILVQKINSHVLQQVSEKVRQLKENQDRLKKTIKS